MTINAKTFYYKIPPSPNNVRYAKYRSSTSNIRFGGTNVLSWIANSGISAGQTLTIQTDGTYNFGNGPTVLIYDDFSGGTPGANIPFNNWNGFFYSRPIYDTGGRDGNTAMKIYAPGAVGTDKIRNFYATFANVTEIFVQFSTYTGQYIGGPSANTFTSNSFWKMVWATDGLYNPGTVGISGSDGNDIVLGTYVSKGLSIVGNDTTTGNTMSFSQNELRTTEKWNFSDWNTFSYWIKANTTSPAIANSIGYIGYVNKRVNTSNTVSNKVMFNPAFPAVINRIHIPGWFGNFDSNNNDNMLWKYDDVYIATGNNAAARVVLGDKNTWADCRDIWICNVSSWASNTINVQIPKTLNGISGMYLYVYDANNSLISSSGVYVE